MNDTSKNPNIEWKKSGFESSEKATRRINEQKAAQYDAFKRNGASKVTTVTPADLPKGLNKIRKKIRDIYDDEEEEDENDFQPSPNLITANNSLLNALSEEEKQDLSSRETLEQMQMQQAAGRLEALITADKLAKSAGLKGLQKKTAAQAMTDVRMPETILKSVVQKDIAKRLKISKGALPQKDIGKFFRGIKRIEAIGGSKQAVRGMSVKNVIQAGDEKKTNDSKIAKMILAKTGRGKIKPLKLKEKSSSKAQKEFNKIMMKKTALKAMEKGGR